jgi:hypothetical protein
MRRRIDTAAALSRLAPGAEFAVVGNDIVWHSDAIPQPTPEAIAAALEALHREAAVTTAQRAIQAHIDAVAQSRQYENGFALAGYVSSTVPAWAAEAQAFIAWRDAVWWAAAGILKDVQDGLAETPTDIIAALPVMEWPED